MRTGLVVSLFVFGVASNAPIVLAQSPVAFTGTGSLTTPRQFHTATLLTNGKVLIAGGTATFQPALASAELYDPSTGTFTANGNMIAPRYMHTATLLPNGKVLIAGGRSDSAGHSSMPLESAELYDPTIGIFTAMGAMTTVRMLHTATLLNNRQVLITGGARDAHAARSCTIPPLEHSSQRAT